MSAQPGKLLHLIRASTGLGTEQFAVPLKRKRSAIASAENGEVDESKILHLVQEALKHYAKDIPEFLAKEAQRLVEPPAKEEPSKSRAPAQAHAFREINVIALNRLKQETVKETIFTDCCDERAFATVVSDTSLEPDVRRGAIAVLDPGAPLVMGGLVGASLINGGIVVRRYTVLPGKNPQVLLTSKYTEEYPVLRLDPKKDAEWIYPVYSFTSRTDIPEA